jgi:hypothetical protein
MYVNKTVRLLYTSTILIYYIHPNIIPLRRGVLDTLCDKVGQWFSLGTLVSSTNKTDRN